MRVLVTGATGFVGSHAAKALQDAGHTVRALVRTPAKLETVTARVGVDLASLETVDGDIADAAAVLAAIEGCDAVVHAAAVVGTDPSSEAAIEASNFAGALNVLGSAADAGCDPIVHVSSTAALFPFSTDPVTGDHPVGNSRMPYARSKADSERLARRLQDSGHGVVIVYPGGVFGPGDYGESTQFKPLKLWVTRALHALLRLHDEPDRRAGHSCGDNGVHAVRQGSKALCDVRPPSSPPPSCCRCCAR